MKKILKNGTKFEKMDDIHRNYPFFRRTHNSTWAESKYYHDCFICIGKGSFSHRAKWEGKKDNIFNEYDNKTRDIKEGCTKRDVEFIDECWRSCFIKLRGQKGKIKFDQRQGKRIYFTSLNNTGNGPYIFRGVYKLSQLKKEGDRQIRIWKQISKDWIVK